MTPIDRELAVIQDITVLFKPLTPTQRARVLLLVTLQVAPNAFGDREYLHLIEQAKEKGREP